MRLGGYIRVVRAGETIIVTEHGEPVAELRPLRSATELDGRLDAMVAAGLLTRGSGEARPAWRPVVVQGEPSSRTLVEARKDRL